MLRQLAGFPGMVGQTANGWRHRHHPSDRQHSVWGRAAKPSVRAVTGFCSVLTVRISWINPADEIRRKGECSSNVVCWLSFRRSRPAATRQRFSSTQRNHIGNRAETSEIKILLPGVAQGKLMAAGLYQLQCNTDACQLRKRIPAVRTLGINDSPSWRQAGSAFVVVRDNHLNTGILKSFDLINT